MKVCCKACGASYNLEISGEKSTFRCPLCLQENTIPPVGGVAGDVPAPAPKSPAHAPDQSDLPAPSGVDLDLISSLDRLNLPDPGQSQWSKEPELPAPSKTSSAKEDLPAPTSLKHELPKPSIRQPMPTRTSIPAIGAYGTTKPTEDLPAPKKALPTRTSSHKVVPSRSSDIFPRKGDLPAPSGQDLPKPPGRDLPSPSRRDLPSPSRRELRSTLGRDLPAPLGSDQPPSQPGRDLPGPSGRDLPGPSGRDLPAPSGFDLPEPSGFDLAEGLGFDLPEPSGVDLPTPPTPKGPQKGFSPFQLDKLESFEDSSEDAKSTWLDIKEQAKSASPQKDPWGKDDSPDFDFSLPELGEPKSETPSPDFSLPELDAPKTQTPSPDFSLPNLEDLKTESPHDFSLPELGHVDGGDQSTNINLDQVIKFPAMDNQEEIDKPERLTYPPIPRQQNLDIAPHPVLRSPEESSIKATKTASKGLHKYLVLGLLVLVALYFVNKVLDPLGLNDANVVTTIPTKKAVVEPPAADKQPGTTEQIQPPQAAPPEDHTVEAPQQLAPPTDDPKSMEELWEGDSFSAYSQIVDAFTNGPMAEEPSADTNAALALGLRYLRYGHLDDKDALAKTLGSIGGRGRKTVEYRLAQVIQRLVEDNNEDAMVLITEVQEIDPNHPIGLHLKGEVHLHQQDADQAISYFLKSLALASDSSRSNYSLGLAYASKEDGQRAQSQFTRVLDKEPNHAMAKYQLAQIAVDNNDLDQALTIAKELVSPKDDAESTPKIDSKAHLLMAKVYLRQGKTEEAIESLNNAQRLDPENVGAMSQLAGVYYSRRQYHSAQSQYNSILALNENDVDSVIGLVKTRIALGHHIEAQEAIAQAIQKHQDDPRLPYYMGRLFDERGNKKEAREMYEKAQSIDPDFHLATAQIAKLKFDDKQHKQAIGDLESALKKAPDSAILHNGLGELLFRNNNLREAERHFQRAVNLDNNYHVARYNLARLLRDTGKHENALKEYERVQGTSIDSIQLNSEIAETYHLLGRHDKAVEGFTAALSMDPNNADYAMGAGRAYYYMGNSEKAQEMLTNALRLGIRMHQAHYYMGRNYYDEGSYNNAIKHFTLAGEEAPQSVVYKYWLAIAFEKIGANKQSSDLYNFVVHQVNVNNAPYDSVPDIFYHRGDLFLRTGRYAEALKDFGEHLKRNRNEPRAEPWFKFAEGLHTVGKHRASIKYYREALKRDNSHGLAHYRIARTYLMLNPPDYKQAIPHLQKAINFDSSLVDCHRQLGYIYRDQGKRDMAIRELRTYLNLIPKTAPDRHEIENQIISMGGRP